MNPFANILKPKIGSELLTVIHTAHECARAYSHDYVGVEHVFLSLRDLPESSPSSATLRLLPIDQDIFWSELEKAARVVTERPVPNTLPHTPRLCSVLKSAARWAKRGKKREITASHFIAAVCTERNSLVAHIFRQVSDQHQNLFTDAHAEAAYFAMLVTDREATLFQPTEPNQPQACQSSNGNPSRQTS